MKKIILLALATTLSAPAAAHEVWLERGETGPARIYLGEPAEDVPEGGDPEFSKLQSPKVFAGNATKPLTITRRDDHLEVAPANSGDLRLRDDSIFAPWGAEGKKTGAIFYARSGRTEAKGKLDLELVPVAPNADRFTLLFRGKPLADKSVNIVSPEKWQKSFKTDANGQVEAPQLGAGRYLLAASHEEEVPTTVGGQPVAKQLHVSTLTFNR